MKKVLTLPLNGTTPDALSRVLRGERIGSVAALGPALDAGVAEARVETTGALSTATMTTTPFAARWNPFWSRVE